MDKRNYVERLITIMHLYIQHVSLVVLMYPLIICLLIWKFGEDRTSYILGKNIKTDLVGTKLDNEVVLCTAETPSPNISLVTYDFINPEYKP